ncbi:phage tail terminator protein [Agarivorans sp. QJM3NY_25]|uniref:phage tail terminator protein n=1 Tax=Agarivorans sp. QJM3NY_25 TaxID=3421430 RepID=UPI003D7D0C93
MNYLAAEAALAERLQQLTTLRKVYLSTNMDALNERNQAAPCAHVLYAGDQLPNNAQGGQLSKVKQTWLVVVAVRLGPDSQQTGQLIDQVLKKIMGHKADGFSPFVRCNTNAKPRVNAGFAYYPLAFTTTFTHQGEQA